VKSARADLIGLLDACWRAGGYCLHPRVLLSALLPLLLAGAALGLVGWAFWEPAVGAVRAALERWELAAALLQWLASIGAPQLRTVVAPMIVVALVTPLVAVLALWLVAVAMVPALVRLVTARRFPALARASDVPAWRRALGALAAAGLALVVMAATAWTWLLPPLALLLPPLVLGWLAARVLTLAVLGAHATAAELAVLRRKHRAGLFLMGFATGALALLPAGLWSLGAVSLIFAPVLMVLASWLYLGVFTFAALWFAHFALARLQGLRLAEDLGAAAAPPQTPPETPPAADPARALSAAPDLPLTHSP